MTDEPTIPSHEQIEELSLVDSMQQSYVDYAMSVIVSRALPDARDGLKPSQRRILYVMDQNNMRPGGANKKCATVVGDTMGKYHPHGDQAIYATLVRLAQDWNLRYPLIIPKGNFGSQDGDPPAAHRYTECRPAETAIDMMGEELKQETVPFVPNFSQELEEPTVLPSMFPNLMANGSEGIAVGMATKIPPHNITEVCDGIEALIDNPDIAPSELMKHIKGPDFPTAGTIMGTDGIRQAYCSTGENRGRGLVQVRARVDLEEIKKKQTFVVTELPYQITRRAVVDKVRDLMRTDRVKGISDVNDMTDKNNPLRIEIELKKDANPMVVLNQLWKYTPLQDTYGINMIALTPVSRDLQDLEPYDFEDVEPMRPMRLNLKDLLEQYRDHRYVMVRRRTNFLLKKARARLHIVEGRIKALDIIDQIIALIRASQTTEEAHGELVSQFGFSDVQAEDILGMPLRQLTGMARENLENERDDLREKIADYEDILDKRERVYAIIKDEVKGLKKKYGDARRTRIEQAATSEIDRADLEAEEEVIVTISHEGYVKRVPLDTYKKQGRGGVGVNAGNLKEGDFIEHLFVTSTHHYILIFTDRGRLFWLRVWDLQSMSRTARGAGIRTYIQLEQEEFITAAYVAKEFEQDKYFVMATRKGVIKKTEMTEYGNVRASGIIAIRLDDGDQLIGVRLTEGTEDIILGTRNGLSIRFPSEDRRAPVYDEDGENPVLDDDGNEVFKNLTGVRAMGRVTRGVRGINLREGDEVVDLIVVEPEEEASILTVCEKGYGKRTPQAQYRCQSRGGKGIINIKANARNGKVTALKYVIDGDELMLMSEHGQAVRFEINPDTIRDMGRATQGVRMKKLSDDDRIVAVTKIPKDVIDRNGEDDDEDDDGDDGPDGGGDGDGGGAEGAATDEGTATGKKKTAKSSRKKKADADEDDIDSRLAELDQKFDDTLDEGKFEERLKEATKKKPSTKKKKKKK